MALTELRERQPVTEVTFRPATGMDVQEIYKLAFNRMYDVSLPAYRADCGVLWRRFVDDHITEKRRIRKYVKGAKSNPDQYYATVATTPNRQPDAKRPEKVVGVLLAERDIDSNICEISDLLVDESFERQGIASRLESDYVRGWVNSHGAESRVEIANARNTFSVCTFFENRGYRQYSEPRWLYPRGENYSVVEHVLFSLQPPLRPTWHESAINQRDADDSFKRGQLGLGGFRENFLVNRANVLRSGGNKPHVREIESACYDLLAMSDTQLEESGFSPVFLQNEFIGLRDNTLPEDEFVRELLTQRAASFSAVRAATERVGNLKGIGRASGLLNLPAVLINVDNPESLQRLGVSSQTITAALTEAPLWKASEHMFLFSHTDKAHDYRRYAIQTSKELGISLDEFLFRQQTHEGIHPLIDYITEYWFGEYATWLNEGFCEFFAGFEERAKYMIRNRSKSGSITVEDVMTTTDNNLRRGGGYFLIKSIEQILNLSDEPVVSGGIGWFINTVSDYKVKGDTLNEKVKSAFVYMGMTSEVESVFQEQIQGL